MKQKPLAHRSELMVFFTREAVQSVSHDQIEADWEADSPFTGSS